MGLQTRGDPHDAKKLVEQAVQGLGGLDIIVNNAARQQARASILDVSSEDFDATMKFGGMTPLGRPGQPAELASIYVQLAAADASYATGQVYGSAGGSGQP